MVDKYPLAKEERVRLYREFYSTYDTEHWLHKIKTWEILLDNSEEFIEEFGGEDLEDSGASKLEKTAKSEIVFSFYHISESLFMLMAATGSHIPWIRLKDIRMPDIENFYKEEIADGPDREKLKDLFYPDMRDPEGHKGVMDDSVEFIQEYLPRMGNWFFDDDREIYNEYKHGLRLSTSEASVQIAPEGQEGEVAEDEVFERGGLSHIYLEREEIDVDEEGDWYKINKVMSGFDYQMFLSMCHINYLLVEQIVSAREKWFQEDSEEDSEINVISFHDFDIDEVFDYDHTKNWKFNFSYRMGEEVTTVD